MNSIPDLALPAVVAISVFILHMIVNWTILPGRRQRSPQRVALLITILTPFLFATAAWRGGGTAAAAPVAVVAACVSYCYFHLFNMSETARRIRILTSLRLGVAVDDSGYPFDRMVDVRLERLVSLGAMTVADGCFSPRRGPLLAAAFLLDWWRSMLFPAAKDNP